MLRIGSSQSDITPAPPVPMGGTFLKFESREVLDPVMASCIVADDGNSRVACVSCDLGTMTRGLVQSIRERAGGATGIPRENIFIASTHNHSGPTARLSPFSDTGEAHVSRVDMVRNKLAEDISACIAEANSRLGPARMGFGRGNYRNGAFNRRFIMSNGRSRMHGKEQGNLKRLKVEGPVDREVRVVWFEDPAARPLAVMLNYSSHPTNFYGARAISADFPGAARGVIQNVLGRDVPVLYLQGACGNIMCREVDNPREEKNDERVRRIGRGLAGEALKIMSDNFALEQDGVSACVRVLEIPYRSVLPMPVEEARERWERYRGRWGEFVGMDIEERASISNTLRIADLKSKSGFEEVEVGAFALGEVFFVTNPAELFVEYQLDIKKRFNCRKIIVTELTNGWAGYVPTRLACALGGYEAIQTRFDAGAGEVIRDAGCELAERLMEEKGI